MQRNFFFTVCTLVLFSFQLNAQQVWSLERCIQYAQQNNLTLKQADYTVQEAQLQKDLAKAARYPSLNANANGGLQFGRTIDPVTNDFTTQTVGFNSYSLNVGAILFDGFRIKNNITQSALNYEAAKLDKEATSNDIGLSIASAYLQILLNEEQLATAKRQRQQTAEQLVQTKKLIRAGVLPANDSLDVVARRALNDQNIIQAANAVEIAYLSLKQLLELDPTEPFRIEKPDLEVPETARPELLNVEEIYIKALATQPQIEASETRLESATVGIDIAKSANMPTLSVGGGLSTNWSSLAKVVTGSTTIINEQPVIFNGNEVILGFPSDIPMFGNNPYFDQLSQNFGQNVGLQLSVPIYNNGRNNATIERAKLGLLNQEVANQRVRQGLKTDIQRAVADAKAAKKAWEAARLSQAAAAAAFDNSEKRFRLGAINTFEYTTAKATLDSVEIDLARAKYQYIFNLKVLDFYLGNKITLD